MAEGVKIKITGDDSGFKKSLQEIGSTSERELSKLTNAAKKAATVLTASIGGAAAAAIKFGSDFEAGMSQVAATMGISQTSNDLKSLKAAAQEAGETTKFSATQASEALNYLALAGYDANKSIKALPTVLNLAAAGGLDLGYASDMVTDSMSALGLETSSLTGFVDELAKTSQKSNTSVGQLGEAILTVGGTAKSLAGGTKELNTMLGILADNGIKGSEGGTALRNIILALSAPTDAAAKKLKQLGINAFDGNGKLRPLSDTFQDFNKKLGSLTEKEKTEVLNTIFNKVDLKSANALLGTSSERFEELSGYIENADGAAQGMADTMNSNLQGDITIMNSALEGLGIAFYETFSDDLRGAIQGITDTIGGLTASVKDGTIGEKIESTVAILKMAIPLVGTGVAAYKSYQLATSAAAAAQALLNTTITLNPIGLAVAGVVAFGAAVWGISAAAKQAKEDYYNMGDEIADAGNKFEEARDKAQLTDDYATEWKELKKAIADNSLSSDELAKAQDRVKELEQWFIDNYGEYISAEEQKNGIRDESIDKLREYSKELSESQRLELENQILQKQSEIPGLQENIDKLKQQNDELEIEKVHHLEIQQGLLKLKNQYNQALNDTSLSDTEFNAELERISKEVEKLTGNGLSGAGIADLEQRIEDYGNKAQDAAKKIEDNNNSIADGSQSIQDYIAWAEQLIYVDLGGTYEEATNKLHLMKQAQDELNSSGSISKDTYDKLVKLLPELKDNSSNPEFLADKIDEVEKALQNADKKLAEFNLRVDKSSKDIVINVKYNTTGFRNVPATFPIPQNAQGTNYSKKGVSVVNERGTELIEGADGSFRYVDSDSAALTYLNQGDKVYTAEQTKRLFGNIKKIPGFAGGKNNSGTSSYDFDLSGSINAGFGELGSGIASSIAEAVKAATPKAISAVEDMGDDMLSAEKEYLNYKSDIEAEQDAYDEAQRRKSYEKKLKDAKTQAEKEEIIAEEERRLYEREQEKKLESLKEAAEKEQKLREEDKNRREEFRDKEFSDLKYYLDIGYITEAEYYDKLKTLRDRYYEQGSEEYKQYTLEIINFQKEYLRQMYEDIAAAAENTVGIVLNKQEALKNKMTEFDLMGEFTINGMGTFPELTDLDAILESNQSWITEMEQFRQRLSDAGASDEVMAALLQEVEGMSKKDGRELMRLYNSKSDSYMKGYVSKYQEILNTSEKLSAKYYTPDMADAQKEFASQVDDIVQTLEDKGYEIPENFFDLGTASAESFGDAFKAEIDSLFSDLAVKMNNFNNSLISMISPLMNFTGMGALTTSINNYSSTYNLVSAAGNGVQGELQAIRNEEILKRMRGGY